MRQARAENRHVAVTLYVNPLQFAAGEDLDEYPRDPEGDAAVYAAEGVDALLVLSDAEMYPPGFGTRVASSVSAGLFEAAARPDHFDGVATVVAKLFAVVRPDRTYFGLKDYQQVLLVRQLAADLNTGVEMISAPTVREVDGLALSSRNSYLSAEERANAPRLYQALREVRNLLDAGEVSVDKAIERGRAVIEAMSVPVTIDYFAVADAHTLKPVTRLGRGVVVLAAVRLPSARLIDNLVLV